jgi:hypothetical protein
MPEKVLEALRLPAEQRKPAQIRGVSAYYRSVAPELAGLREQLVRATFARDRLLAELPSMPVSRSVEPRPIRVLPRGNWMDDSGEVVEPGVPAAFRQITPGDGRRVSRLDLAEWLVSADNPLTARTFVNRLWRLYFGVGLSRTLEDLGSQGEWPTHPELLDWLAVEFRESGWDVKKLYRLIVTSATYRQTAAATPAHLAVDPTNKFLARGPRFRMDGEMLRDSALAASGLLVEKLGGPSVRPYQPPGIWEEVAMPESNTRTYVPDKGEGLYRRSVYTFWKRASAPASLETFDATSRETVCTKRARTNTPLQAFVTMNDPQWLEAARKLGEQAVKAAPDPRRRLDFLAQATLARALDDREAKVLAGTAEKFAQAFAAAPAEAKAVLAIGESPTDAALSAADVATWAMVASQFLNLDEFLTK